MNCREFRRKHDAYIDDTLSGLELDAMTRHRRFCERCAHLDTSVRRALLVARNLPVIHPSPAFNERLQARLAVERKLMQAGHIRVNLPTQRWYSLSVGAYVAITTGVLVAVGLVEVARLAGSRDDVVRLVPVVAMRPESAPSLMMTPAMVASMPAGMPLWPAVFVAQQAPYHLAGDAINAEYLGH